MLFAPNWFLLSCCATYVNYRVASLCALITINTTSNDGKIKAECRVLHKACVKDKNR